MKITFYKPIENKGKLKCAVHLSGRMGFSGAAIEELGIDEKKFIKIGTNDEEKSKDILYMIVTDTNDGEGFKVNKAGKYYYLNTKQMFDDWGIDYSKIKILYDISVLNESEKIYKLVRRELNRKKT